MKTKVILLATVFFALMCGKTQAQAYTPFPDSNAVWSVLHFLPFNADSTQYYTKLYGLFDDTIINTLKYNKLYFNDGTIDSTILISSPNTFYICAIRQDTIIKKVYFIPKDSINELVLYDFSVNVGDTFYVYNEIGSKVKAWCISLGAMVISGKIRNIYSIKSDNLPWGFHSYIEGVGNILGFFLNYYPFPNQTTVVKCLTANDSLLYEYDGNLIWGVNIDTGFFNSCYHKGVFIYTYTHEILKNSIIISPIPLKNSAIVIIPENLKLNQITLDIFDLQGRKIRDFNDVNSHQLTLYREDFKAAGIYFVRIKSEKYLETIKLLVQ